MLHLIIGGAASGKSAYAEALAHRLSGGTAAYYIATMRPFGSEAAARIQKHRTQRAALGFTSLECYQNLHELTLPQHGSVVLLECLTNLAANELYTPQNELCPHAQQKILQGIAHLHTQAAHLVLVSGDVFADTANYPPQTLAYIQLLGACNCALAATADTVTEVVAGLPVYHKKYTGEGPINASV